MRARIAGSHPALTPLDVEHHVRALAAGEPRALFGLPAFPGITVDGARLACREQFGWAASTASTAARAGPSKAAGPKAAGPKAANQIDPLRTVAGAHVLGALLAQAAAAGARVAFATARPASLLPLYQTLARSALDAGAVVLGDDESEEFRDGGRAGRRLRWYHGVAVVVDRTGLLDTDAVEAADEWLFHLPRPELVVADRGFAGVSVARGIATVACCDLDTPALAMAAASREHCTLVPFIVGRPPVAYDLIAALAAVPQTSDHP